MKKIVALLTLFYAQCILAADVRFLALSDIHFDPYISCYGKKRPCPVIQALQNAPSSQWSTILATYNTQPPVYREDTGYPLLKTSLATAQKAAAINQVQFVMILGDFLGHDYKYYFREYSANYSRANYISFVKKTFEFLNHQIAITFPKLNVYAVVGNNDSYSADYGYYPKTGFFSETGALWSTLIKDSQNREIMNQQFSKAGYYAVNLSPELRLIVLNSVLFSTKANGKEVDRAAQAELEWFEKQLQTARENNQKVFIAMHIPPGIDIFASLKFRLFRMIDLWNETDIDQYQSLLQKYAPEIAGIFAGHLHVDLMQTVKLSNQNSVSMLVVPAISPIFGTKPSFNIYQFTGEMYKLGDIENYKYSLGKPGVWGGKLSWYAPAKSLEFTRQL